MRERLEIVFESEDRINVEKVTETLKSSGLEYKSVSREKIGSLPKPLSKSQASRKGCCGQDKQSPSLSKKAMNYAKTMARWIAAGKPIVAMKAYANRLLICSDCDSFIKDTECSECGCPMEFKAKMDLKGLCELNKWQ